MKIYNEITVQGEIENHALHGCLRKEVSRHGADGFSLLETLVAIVVFAVVVTSIGSSLVMAHRINARSEVLIQEQLKVSRAVEGIMAGGIDASIPEDQLDEHYDALYPEVILSIYRGSLQEERDENGDGEVELIPIRGAFYTVIVQSRELPEEVNVTTYVRPVNMEAAEGGGL